MLACKHKGEEAISNSGVEEIKLINYTDDSQERNSPNVTV